MPTFNKFRHIHALILALLLGSAAALYADDSDHDRARRALEQGQVLALHRVLHQVESQFQGQVLKIEFEDDDGQFIYKIRLLQADGKLLKLKINALNGEVLGIKQRGR